MINLFLKDYYMNKNKSYYNPSLENLFKRLSLNDRPVVVGSSSLKGSFYETDYDLFEVVIMTSSTQLKNRLQNIIKTVLNTDDIEITDIKLGLDNRRKLIPNNLEFDFKQNKLLGYDRDKLLIKLEQIKPYLTTKEYKYSKKLLVKNPNFNQSQNIMKELRFNIIRWTPQDIKKGYVKLYGGTTKSIEECFLDNTLFKIDYLIFYNNEYIEISIIYDIRDKNNKRINLTRINPKKSLMNDYYYYMYKKQYYKALKRKVSLYRYLYRNSNHLSLKQEITESENILNSQLSILYKANNLITALIKSNHLTKQKRINSTNKIIQYLSNCNLDTFLEYELEIKQLLDTFRHAPHKKISVIQKANDLISYCLNKDTKKLSYSIL